MTVATNTPKVDFKFALVTTGGTIAGLKTDEKHYQSAELKGQAFAAQFGLNQNKASDPTGTLTGQVEWAVYSPYSIGSQNLSMKEMLTLRELLMQLNADNTLAGVLVTHGTDTMEDMLFFLHLTMPALNKPILFTGSMYTSDSPQSDAQGNISDALQFLKAMAASDVPLLGLVMNRKYTPAWQVQKQSTHGVNAFDCEGSIPIAEALDCDGAARADVRSIVENCSEHFGIQSGVQYLEQAKFSLPDFSAAQIYEQFEQCHVELVYCTPNLRQGSIQSRFDPSFNQLQGGSLGETRRRTLVIAAPGNGNIPSRFVPELQVLISQGVRVVRASRIVHSSLMQGGELTGLESMSHPQSTMDSSGGKNLNQASMADQLYCEAYGMSLNQVVVMESCRLLQAVTNAVKQTLKA